MLNAKIIIKGFETFNLKNKKLKNIFLFLSKRYKMIIYLQRK
jgi:hypothetical protein